METENKILNSYLFDSDGNILMDLSNTSLNVFDEDFTINGTPILQINAAYNSDTIKPEKGESENDRDCF